MSMDTITFTVVSLYVGKAHGTANVQVPELVLSKDGGVVGDKYKGHKRVHSTGELVLNPRQFTAVNPRELGMVAEVFGVPYIDPAWLSANICFTCPTLKKFTEYLVKGTRLFDASGHAILEIRGVTDPCLDAGKVLASQFPDLPLRPPLFPKAAHNLRGVYGIVLEDNVLRQNDRLTMLLPSA